jgi:5-methylcytosine-specific restriction endonuclease McrA
LKVTHITRELFRCTVANDLERSDAPATDGDGAEDPEDLEGDLAPIDPVALPEDPAPTTPVSETILSLMTEVQDGSIDIQPKWQRRDIWSDKKKAALIESIFFNLPLPLFYLAQANRTLEGEEVTYREVVDGQQRMRAIRDFYSGELVMPDDSVVEDLQGKTYTDLGPKRKEFFKQFKLSTATIPLRAEVSKYELFRRLNQSPTTLSDQELRNAAYHGDYLDLLIDKAKDLGSHLRVTESNYKRMKDVEFLTRLVAFERKGPSAFPNKKLAQFLNEEMELGGKDAVDARAKRIARVAKALERTYAVFGDYRFRPFRVTDEGNEGEWATALNRPLMEVQVWSLLDHSAYGFKDGAAFDRSLQDNRLDIIENARHLHVLNERFNDTLQRGTTGKPNVEFRFERYRAMMRYSLESVSEGKKRRFFTRQQKQNIWDRLVPDDRVCVECGHPLSFENADVDHIRPFAEGGETVEENGQLLHAACNRAKGARWDPVSDAR